MDNGRARDRKIRRDDGRDKWKGEEDREIRRGSGRVVGRRMERKGGG
jgi:hypothetical protein